MTGRPFVGDAEEDARPVPIEEEQVPERLHLPGELEVFRVAGVAVEDQVGQDGLLLLPEVLGVPPGELDRPAVAGLPLDRVEAAAAELVDPDLAHLVPSRFATFIIFSACASCPFDLVEVGHAGEVPGDLQVVADHGAVLLPAPGVVGLPVGVEPLVDVGDVRVLVRELVGDQVGGGLDHLEAQVAELAEVVLAADGQRVERQHQVDRGRRAGGRRSSSSSSGIDSRRGSGCGG